MKTAFILDDNFDIIQQISYIVERNGWNVVYARCVEDAIVEMKKITRIGEFEINLIFLDLMLPITQRALEQIDSLESQRAKLRAEDSRRHMVEAKSNESVATWEESANLANKIRSLNSEHGGIDFLREILPISSNWKLVVFSAMEKDIVANSLYDLIGKDRIIAWIQKVDDPAHIDSIIKNYSQQLDHRTISPVHA